MSPPCRLPDPVRWAGLCLASVLLGACAQPVPPAAPACGATTVPSKSVLRMVLSFREPLDGAAPDTLAQLQRYSGLCVRYAASVSPQVHVYLFPGDVDAATLRQRLTGWSRVRDAVPDQRTRAP